MREEIDGISVRRTWIYAGAGKSVHIRLANSLSFTFTALLGAHRPPPPCNVCRVTTAFSWPCGSLDEMATWSTLDI
jgi:hypothetical protein